MIRKFYDTLKSLLPKGRAFKIPLGTQFRDVMEALGEEPDRIREYFDDTRNSGIPGRIPTACLGEWEDMLNLKYDALLTTNERQSRILARTLAVSGQGAEYIQDSLINSGYPIRIYDDVSATENLSGKYNIFGKYNDALRDEILTEVPTPLDEYSKYLTGKFTRLSRIEDIEVMACGKDGQDVIIGQDGGRLYYSIDYGSVFSEIQPAGAADKDWKIAKIGYNGDFVICGIYGGRLYLSSTGYVNLAEVQPAGNTDQNWNCVACTPDGKYILVGTSGKRLWYSANIGAAWAEVQPLGATDQLWLCCAISEDGKYQVAGNDTKLYLSSNNGVAWSEIQPFGAVNRQWCFCSISNSGKTIVCAASGYDEVKRSLDYGATWATVLDDTYYTGGVSTWIMGQADYYNYCIILYAGLGTGGSYAYITHDCGESWIRYNPSQSSQLYGSDHPWRMALSMISGEKNFRNSYFLYLAFVTDPGDYYLTELNIFRFEQLYNNIGIIAGVTIDTVLNFASNLKYDFFDIIYRLKPLGSWLNCKVNFRKDWTVIVQEGSKLNLPAFSLCSMAGMTNNRIAFYDGTNEDMQCYEWDGIDWTQIGNDFNIAGSAGPTMCSFLNGDVIMIDSTLEKLGCYRFDGTDWSLIGKNLSIPGIATIGMTALTSGLLAFMESSAINLKCYQFDGYNWLAVGNVLNIGGAGIPALTTLNSTDIAYIDSLNLDLRCYRFDGTDWAQVGNDLNIAGLGRPSICSMNDTDIILIDTLNCDLRCYRFDGTDWAQIGADFPVVAFGNNAVVVKLTDETFAYIDASAEDLTTYRLT